MTICDHAIGNSYFIGGQNQLSKEVTINLNNKLIQEQILSWGFSLVWGGSARQ